MCVCVCVCIHSVGVIKKYCQIIIKHRLDFEWNELLQYSLSFPEKTRRGIFLRNTVELQLDIN